jgi:hypothetical protein
MEEDFMKANHLTTIALALLFCANSLAQQANPFNGTWKMNLAKGRIEPGPGPANPITTKIELTPGGMNIIMVSSDSPNEPQRQTIRPAVLDGKDHPVTGPDASIYDTMAVPQIDSHTLKEVYKKGGVVVRMGRRVISADGKTMTFSGVGTGPDGKFGTSITVYDRQ